MELLRINRGQYELNGALTATVKTDIVFQLGSTYLLSGDNGTGKTTFLRKIFIPRIAEAAKNNFLFFYTEQDISIQFYIIKAYYKGLKNDEKGYSTIEEGLNNLKDEFLSFNLYKEKQIVFILDEIDQYLSIVDFIGNLPVQNTTLILVTHNKHKLMEGINTVSIDFKKIDINQTAITLN